MLAAMDHNVLIDDNPAEDQKTASRSGYSANLTMVLVTCYRSTFAQRADRGVELVID